MRVQTDEWQQFIPGVRMHKGKKTLFYNGEIFYEGDAEDGHPLIYDWEERDSWEVVIVLPGVEVIPEWTFYYCENIETVIMADTVKRIEKSAFKECYNLEFAKLSKKLEIIGEYAFVICNSLTSIFIPPSCREIGDWAFCNCIKLLILGLPQHVQLGKCVFIRTALNEKSPLEVVNEEGYYDSDDDEEVEQWIKSINDGDAYALHRVCASFNPLSDIIYALVKRKGIQAMRMPNTIGITPSEYLEANTFADISEKEIINRFTVEMMGEVI